MKNSDDVIGLKTQTQTKKEINQFTHTQRQKG